MILKDKCSKCKSKHNLMPNSYTKSLSVNGDIVGYRMCNTCNTKRQLAYRQTESGRRRRYQAQLNGYKKNPTKQRARLKLYYGLKVGKIIRPESCGVCNKHCKPDGHHREYSKPLAVDWLCRQCHAGVHRGTVVLS